MLKPIHFFAAIALSMAPLVAQASQPANYGDHWTVHSSFENQPRKIIDTPDEVYVLAHQHLYSPTANAFNNSLKAFQNGYYYFPAGSIFIYDKKSGSSLEDLSHQVRLSGYDIRLMNYNPANGSLVVAYQDGGIDIIDSNKKLTYIDAVKKRSTQTGVRISSISFGPDNDIWLGTGSGYVRLAADGKFISAPGWNEAVRDIVPVGDYVVCAIGNTLYVAPKDANLGNRTNFKPVSGLNNYTDITNIMPLGHNNFGIVLNAGNIYWFTPDGDGKWKQAGSSGNGNVQAKVSANVGNYVVNQIDHTVTPTQKGFYIAATDKAYLLNRAESAGSQPTLTQISLPSGSNIYSSSYDGSRFWFYTNPRGLASRTYSNSTWGNVDLTLEANGPLGSKDNFILYSKTQGTVIVSAHPVLNTNYYSEYKTPMVAAYKDGKWKNLSPIYNKPNIAKEGSEAESQFETQKNKNKWPVTLPIGACIDPLNPDVLFLGASFYNSMAAIYLDDPTKTPFIFTDISNNNVSAFGPNTELLTQDGWTDFGNSIPLGADKDNNIWIYYNYSNNSQFKEDLFFYYITPEDRQNAIELANPLTKHIKLSPLRVPSIMGTNFWIFGTLNPRFPNKIITATKENDAIGGGLRIVDHNGTLQDTSDDSITYIRKFRTETGYIVEPSNMRGIASNPVTGDVIVSDQNDTYIVNLDNPVVDGIMDVRLLTGVGENGETVPVRAAMRSNVVCFDDYGRIWVGTEDHGVLGFSPDGNKLIAQYDKTNSPLNNNSIHGIGWNPETKSLFISSGDVIAEVRVDVPVDSSVYGDVVAKAPFAVPAKVSSDFGGIVAFHNVPEGLSLRVRDSKGNTVCELPAPVDGVTHWNLLDASGNRVETDVYTVLDASGNNNFAPILLPVVK